MSSTSNIVQFYNNRSVFLTGATGFVGKATIEKLLRSCSGIKNIYILVRPKAGSDIRLRLLELVDNSLFEKVRYEDPDILSKIVPIDGDITQPKLGISEDDQNLLVEEVSVVIHSAATVKFDENLKLSINVNVNGIKRLIELCKRMKNLVSIVHVSTAYSNCERNEINEVIYPQPTDPLELLQFMELMDDEHVNIITPELVGNKPNTYTYTKALAENILSDETGVLPICIVRPSIVTATWKEPVAGWVDNVNGPTGLIVAVGKGMLRTLLGHENKVADLIPLDLTVNLILAAAWYTANARSKKIVVYNFCSGDQNPLTWGDFTRRCCTNLINHPFSNVLLYPGMSFRGNHAWHSIQDFLVHYLPASLFDFVAYISGKKPVMRKVYKKLSKTKTVFEYFTTNEWKFNTDNTKELNNQMSIVDQQLFNFNSRDVNWEIYIDKYCKGIRKYALKDDISTLAPARKRVQRMYWIQQFTQVFLILCPTAIIFRCVSVYWQ